MIASCALFLALALSAFAVPLSPEATYSGSVQGSRIISGWEAQEGQFPYQLGLRLVNAAGQIHACGASLIDAEWALTAAHCVAQRVHVVVAAGSTSFSRPAALLDAAEYFTHPDFADDEASTVQANDIGLVKFSRALEFNDRIQPIRLQSSADKDRSYDGIRLVASGWGTTATGGYSPDALNWVYLRGIDNWFCSEAYGFNPIVQNSTICTIGYNAISQSTCHGDNGSPLALVDEDGVATQVGVSSFLPNLGCHLGIPAGFVRPGHYQEWFTEVTGIDFESEDSSEDSNEESGEDSGEDSGEEEVTEAPEETTTASDEESGEEEVTEAPEDTTTASDEDSGEEEVTEAPEDTTTAPDEESGEEEVTEAPEDTTTASDEESGEEEVTEAPEDTTTASDEDSGEEEVTEAPEETTTASDEESSEEEVTVAPEEATTAPDEESGEEEVTEAPEEETETPEETTVDPETTEETEAPEETTDAPEEEGEDESQNIFGRMRRFFGSRA